MQTESAQPTQTALPMSRAMNVALEKSDVIRLCGKHKAAISDIEVLLSGGTRVVMMNGDDAAVMRKAFGNKLFHGKVTRSLWVRNQ